MTTIRTFLFAALSLLCATGASAQGAADYPNQTVKIINPFTAGSVSDILARVLADKLGTLWKQTVVVENKPGIAGTISVANSPPDGYTLMSTSNGHTIINALNKDLTIDPVKDFAGVSMIASVPLVLIINNDLPAKDLKELIALAKAKPGTMNFTSAGLASSNYLGTEVLKQTANIDLAHVPFRGTPEQFTSLMRGDAHVTLSFLGPAVPFITSNKVRALAVTSPQRYPALPDVPTMAEAGMPDYKYDSWFGIMAPGKTPPAIVKKIHDDIVTVMKDPELLARWQNLSAIPAVSKTPAEFDAIIRADVERYNKVLTAAGVTAK
jgi:tripartite-type tricarboxylate transporter receptor subunit TctC